MSGLARDLATEAVAGICRRHGVRELSVFGSIARGEVREGSDVDLLVEFEEGARVGFLSLARMARELSEVLGRKVDLVPKAGLKPAIREAVLAEAEVVFEV